MERVACGDSVTMAKTLDYKLFAGEKLEGQGLVPGNNKVGPTESSNQLASASIIDLLSQEQTLTMII